MSIRNACISDEMAIIHLMDQLGYNNTHHFLRDKMLNIAINPNAEIIVYEVEKKVVAFLAIDIITQLGLAGDVARISYFAVEDFYKGRGIGSAMEVWCEAYAKKRNCDSIELHCHDRRKDAHYFYMRHGYQESPKYFIKKLDEQYCQN